MIKIKILLIWSLLMLTAVHGAQAGAPDFKDTSATYEMQPVVVTATRVETSRAAVAANVGVLTAEDIEKMPVSNAAEALQYMPGVYVEFNGGPGSDASAVRIQGSEKRHVTILQDGVPLNQLANPLTDLSYLPIDAIDRIEVYKGAASSAWGSALGGVINIITKNPDPKRPFAADLRTGYGGHQTSKSKGTVSGTVDRFGYLVSLTHDESDGFIEHTEYEQDAAYVKVDYELPSAGRLNFACFYDKGRNADPVPNFAAFWDDIDRKRTYQRLLFEILPADNLVLTVEGRHHRFYNHIDDVYSGNVRVIYNDYLDEIWGVSGRLNWDPTDTNRLNVGYDQDWGRYDWINYADEYRTRNWALYANDTLNLDQIALNAGMRYDNNKEFGDVYSPSAGVVYRFTDQDALIRTQVSRGFSAPPAAWVHDPVFGNPDLEPEIAVNYQLGGEVRLFQPLKLELNFFRADVKDLILYDSNTSRYENIDKVRRQGLEGTVSAAFDCGLTLAFGGSYVDVRDKATDNVIEDIPRKTYNILATYSHNRMTHSIIGKYIDHNSSYPETQDEVFIFDYLLKVNLPFWEQYGRVSIFGAVYNLFNTTCLYRYVWPQPDRWAEGGVRIEY